MAHIANMKKVYGLDKKAENKNKPETAASDTYWTYDRDDDDNSPHIYEWTNGKVVKRYCADDKGGMMVNKGAPLDDYESKKKYTDKDKLFALALKNYGETASVKKRNKQTKAKTKPSAKEIAKAAEKAKVKAKIKSNEKAAKKSKKAETAGDDTVITSLQSRKEGIIKSIVNMRKQIQGINTRIKARRVSNAKKKALAKGKKKPAVV